MQWALFNPFYPDGLLFLLRWGHFLFGIAWIGILWYFNFAQGPFMNEVDAAVKTAVNQKLTPRTLWYFRWGAMGTVLTGWLIILLRVQQGGMALFSTSWGATILTGAFFGTIMWFNVWFVIWPRQKKVMAAANGQQVEGLPAMARRAFLASRTNTLLSIPLLFMMGAASHLAIAVDPARVGSWLLIVLAVLALIEINSLVADKGATTKPIEKVRGVISSGLVLTVILYVVMELVL